MVLTLNLLLLFQPVVAVVELMLNTLVETAVLVAVRVEILGRLL
jgi:hypothetical protein